MGSLLDTIHSRIERRPDTLESILWDVEGQKLSGPTLIGLVISEVKARTVWMGNWIQWKHYVNCRIDYPLVTGMKNLLALLLRHIPAQGRECSEVAWLQLDSDSWCLWITVVQPKKVSPRSPEKPTRQRHWLPKENSSGLRWKYSYRLLLIVDSAKLTEPTIAVYQLQFRYRRTAGGGVTN